MDMPHSVSSACVVDMQQHNPHQGLYRSVNYEKKEFEPKRNSYVFEGVISHYIINSEVKEKINFLIKIGFPFKERCHIRCTSESWSLKYYGIIKDDIIKILIQDKTLKYIEINKTILKDEKMIEVINSNKIEYNSRSFRQSDDSIKNEIYKILSETLSNKKICFVGGEMVFYKALLNPSEYIMYTDYESIYLDSISNGNLNTFLIDYDKDQLKRIDSDFILIANTSKGGLGKNLAKSISELDLNQIVIISCNKKSFQRDFIILKEKYFISMEYELKTNMSVWIIFLYKNKN